MGECARSAGAPEGHACPDACHLVSNGLAMGYALMQRGVSDGDLFELR